MRLRQLDALLHAGRVGFEVAVARFAEADVIEHLVRALHGVGRRAGRTAGRSRRRTTPRSCRECASRSPACSRCGRESPAATWRHRGRARSSALVGHQEAEQRLEQRALAGAVRAQQADGAGREHRRDVVQRPVLAVADAELIAPGRRGRVGTRRRAEPGPAASGMSGEMSGIAGAASREYTRLEPLQRSPQPQRIGLQPHETNDVGDVLLERQAHQLGAALQVLARHLRARRPCPSCA